MEAQILKTFYETSGSIKPAAKHGILPAKAKQRGLPFPLVVGGVEGQKRFSDRDRYLEVWKEERGSLARCLLPKRKRGK